MHAKGTHARVATVLIALVVAACRDASPSSPPAGSASPVPSVSAGPAATPTATAAASSIAPSAAASVSPLAEPVPYQSAMALGDVHFTPDGRALVVEQDFDHDESQVTLLDAAGRPLPGWPWRPDHPHDAAATAALGPDGSFWVAVRSAGEPAGQGAFWLYRLDDHGQVLPGFPVHVAAGSFCEIQPARDGDVLMNCETDNDTGTPTTSNIDRFRPDGSLSDGWPVKFDGGGTLWGERTDGAVLVVSGSGRPWQLTMLAPDGSPVAGWPRTVPGEQISASPSINGDSE